MQSRKILLVESRPQHCIELESGLKQAGCLVTSFSESTAATAYVKTQKFDFYILDIAALGSALAEIFEELQKQNVPTERIVLTSVKAEVEEYKACKLTGCDLLLKPIQQSLLLERLNAVFVERRKRAS